MKIFAVTAFLIGLMLVISVLMDMAQGFSLMAAIQNNLNTIKMTTFTEWVTFFIFFSVLLKEAISLRKLKKNNP
ncbi:hypothetical protein LWS67_14010 [Bacillus atrophaeus]|uniref:hypothetical protein n=1 Tax=Bacillus atrophaeus TaxID=1452 RepID=UPI001EFB6F49|nr:hypothetical protein [Bacillus atrophaeus]MCG8397638.1 hypothetical protein [Bacillus atrophaeus]